MKRNFLPLTKVTRSQDNDETKFLSFLRKYACWNIIFKFLLKLQTKVFVIYFLDQTRSQTVFRENSYTKIENFWLR